MASIRQLKKDVDQLTLMVIEDCVAHYARKEDKDAEVAKLIESTIQHRLEIRQKINEHRKKASAKERRAFLNELMTEFLKDVHGRFVNLSEIIQK
jgi:hypothetical protein